MRVDFNAGNAVPENAVPTSSPVRPQSAATTETVSGDSTRFFSGEVGVSTLASVALHEPEVRSAKVEALRQQIASGNYAVSPQQIAGSILEQLRTSGAQGR